MLSQSLLTLGLDPGSVREARRWVASRCAALGRPELSACAETGVSELVTNALLHASAPIQVSVAGTRGHLRVEVRDSSTEAPALPQLADLDLEPEDDDLPLQTFGRGLGIVARSSLAWGADIDADGKVVWFEPAEEIHEEKPPEGRITGLYEQEDEGVGHLGQFEFRGFPVHLLGETLRHHRELRREVRLLALGHGSSDPLARDLSDIFAALDRPLRGAQTFIEQHAADAEEVVDLAVQLPPSFATGLGRLNELLDLADTFSRRGQLLSPVRTLEQRSFQQWFLGELVRQSADLEPTRYLPPQPEPDGVPVAGETAPPSSGT